MMHPLAAYAALRGVIPARYPHPHDGDSYTPFRLLTRERCDQEGEILYWSRYAIAWKLDEATDFDEYQLISWDQVPVIALRALTIEMIDALVEEP